MGKKSRRPASNVPSLPNEIKALIVEQLGISEDNDTILSLLNTSSDFAQVCRRELYRHVDFRGKSLSAVKLFTSVIAPRSSRYVLSVALAIPERDDPAVHNKYAPAHTQSPGESAEEYFDADGTKPTWRFFAEADTSFARALASLSNVVTLNLTVPTHQLDTQEFPLWASTFGTLAGWEGLKHLTIRSADWSQDLPFLDIEPASRDAAMEALAPHRHLHTLRLLGIGAFSRGPRRDQSLAERPIPSLSDLRALHLSGFYISQFMESAVKWGATNLTHLVLSERDEGGVEALQDLLDANNATLESLAIRQRGDLDWSESSGPPPAADAFPYLERLALEIDTGATPAIVFFSLLKSVNVVEIGAGDEETVADILALLRLALVWPKLEELSLAAHGELDDWSELYEMCEKRGVELIPGSDVESDFPCTRP
ncbi:hypothetical protein BCR35DRAFT_309418 [Leucosporidium creatinivorum]|uniref:Uncharacterized protein n=1 Tax=Leucosporidium creatinivorum TaxID=106004 RepID=A0A1Y2DHF2_9BASI|nr:hypothetical protein BCR35DRAFT_309418 [Leucosporidium creatinivorum]